MFSSSLYHNSASFLSFSTSYPPSGYELKIERERVRRGDSRRMQSGARQFISGLIAYFNFHYRLRCLTLLALLGRQCRIFTTSMASVSSLKPVRSFPLTRLAPSTY